jgi:hypothetical protein
MRRIKILSVFAPRSSRNSSLLRLAFHAIKMLQIYFVGCNQKSLRFSPARFFTFLSPLRGLAPILWRFPGAENLKKFDFLESFSV